MRLVLYLPALNEAQTIGAVLDAPSEVVSPASSRFQPLSSTTVRPTAPLEIASARVAPPSCNIHKISALAERLFPVSPRASRAGADIIVSMDADGQFRGEDVERLYRALRCPGKADVVLCSRFAEREHGRPHAPGRSALATSFLRGRSAPFAGTALHRRVLRFPRNFPRGSAARRYPQRLRIHS